MNIVLRRRPLHADWITVEIAVGPHEARRTAGTLCFTVHEYERLRRMLRNGAGLEKDTRLIEEANDT